MRVYRTTGALHAAESRAPVSCGSTPGGGQATVSDREQVRWRAHPAAPQQGGQRHLPLLHTQDERLWPARVRLPTTNSPFHPTVATPRTLQRTF
eukprot:169802-Prorocentrum_minimum.AAC.3